MFHTPLIKRWRIRGGVGSVKRYIAFAARKADQLHANPLGRSSLVMRLPGGVTLTIELLRQSHQALITLIGAPVGSGTYQFWGSVDRLYFDYTDPRIPGRYVPRGYAVLATASTKGAKGTPLCTSVEPPPDNEWTYDADPLNTDEHMPLTPAHHPNGVGSNQWWGAERAPWLITSWQQELPLHSLGRYSAGKNTNKVWIDAGFDYGPNYFGDVNAREGVNKSPDSDWYQQACIRDVVSVTHGTRQFIIMVDINSVFYCYPTEGYGDEFVDGVNIWPGEKTNVPLELTQSQVCPFPSWVTNEPLGQAAYDLGATLQDQQRRLRTKWAFNRDGTRAACIAGHRDPPWSDGTYSSEYNNSQGVFQYNTQEDYPGMVEVSFTINLTGPNLGDFLFSVGLQQEIYSKTSTICPVAVGYALKDMGSVPFNALIMLEYRHYTDTPSMTLDTGYEFSPAQTEIIHDVARPNLATLAVFQWQNGPTWETIRQFPVHYGCFPAERRGWPPYEERKFSPLITDFVEVPNAADYVNNHFNIYGNFMALDLGSLSFAVTWAAATEGRAPRDGNAYVAEAAVMRVFAFNEQVERKEVGHPLMVSSVEDIYGMTATYPDFSAMTQIHLGGTASYTHYEPAWAPGNLWDYATIAVTDGAGGSWSNLAGGVTTNFAGNLPPWSLQSYPLNIANDSRFTGWQQIVQPFIFRFFDYRWVVYPGIMWTDDSQNWNGSINFSGFPYAALYHGHVAFATLSPLNNSWARMAVYPDGAYAYFLGPIAAQTQVLEFDGSEVQTPVTHEQAICDRIQFREGDSTTHIAMLNQAFNKSLTQSDYHFRLRPGEQVTDGVKTPELQPQADNPVALGWYSTQNGNPLGIGFLQPTMTGRSLMSISACYGSALYNFFPYDGFADTQTFPTPKMESMWLPRAD